MLLDRVSIKSEAKDIVKNASVSAYLFTLLFLALSWLLAGMSDYVSLNEETVYNIYYATGVDLSFLVLHRAFPALLVTFITILAALLGVLLEIGYILYHLGIRRGREMPYLTLFDGFSFNLCENPDMGVMEALNMSKAQTGGFKWQMFVLDLSFLGWMLLCGLTLGILSIWVQPYILQTNVGYFQQIKAAKGIGWTPRGPEGEDHTFHPNDPFDNTDNTGL